MPRAKGLWSRLRGLQGLRDHLGLARARGRQPAAGEKNPVINELFFVLLFVSSLLRPRTPSSTSAFLVLCCVFVSGLCLLRPRLFLAF